MKVVKKLTVFLVLFLFSVSALVPAAGNVALAAGISHTASKPAVSSQTSSQSAKKQSETSKSTESKSTKEQSEASQSTDDESAESQSASESSEAMTSVEDSQAESTAKKQASKKTVSSNGMISSEDFEIQIACGLNRNYRMGASIPVTIQMESLKEDFGGIVRIVVPRDVEYSDTEAVAYEKEVLLTAGAQKTVTMSITANMTLSALRFELEDQKGKIVLESTVTMKTQSGDSALVGVLSEDYTALNYFDGNLITLDSYSGTVQLLELKESDMPEQASGLEALSYLIINSFDTSILTQNQLAAIQNWVEQGGVLILGTGSDYKQTLSGFSSDFISGTIGKAVKGSFYAVGTADEKSGDVLKFTEKQGLLEISLKEGRTLNKVVSADQFVWNRDYGKGHVVVTAFNLGMEPLVSWSGRELMASSLLEKSAQGYSDTRISALNYGGYNTDTWSLSNALDRLHQIGYPNINLMQGIFLVFVILIGPGLYLILKLVDKREWMWLLVPMLAISCTAVIFIVSKDMRIDHMQTASITTLYYEDGVSNGIEQVSMAVQVPQADRQELELDASLSNLRLYGQNYDYMYSYMGVADPTKYEYKTAIRETAKGYQMGITNGSTFASTYLTLNHSVDASQDLSCGLETNLERKTTGIVGTITNHTGRDLHWLSLYSQSRMVMIGELKDGETVQIKESDNRIFQYDLYQVNVPGYTVDSKEYNIQMQIWELFSSQYLVGMEEKDVYIYASLGDWEADYVSDDRVEEQNIAVLVKHEEMGFSDYEGAELFSLYDCVDNGNSDWDIDGMMCSQTAEVEFDLSHKVTKVHALIRAKDSEALYGNTKNVKTYAYNVVTEAYEELFTDGEIMEFKKSCPYLTEQGTIKMKFVCKSPYDDYSPQITVVGGFE